jgi:hypothetical protein
MPDIEKPLFRPDAVRPKLAGFKVPPAADAHRARLDNWAKKLRGGKLDKLNETQLLPDFITDVFADVLGYVGPAGEKDTYTLRRETPILVDGKRADAGLGRFVGDEGNYVAVLEGKGPRDPLDRPSAGRKRSAVEQALQYAVQLEIDWYLVTNLREIRLYHKGHDTHTFERFETARLAADDAEFRRFVFLFGAERLAPAAGGTHLDGLLAESKKIGRELTAEFYHEYRQLRENTFAALRKHNSDRDPAALLAATQKLLDRVLFIAFCEDRDDLIPRDLIAHTYRHADPYHPRPVWDNFVALFRAVDAGSPHLNVERYNGGLFARDDFLESLAVPDAVCDGFRKLAEYEYGGDPDTPGKLIDVEILGHIFEQSITDLEELHRALAAGPAAPVGAALRGGPPSKRKKEGAFYTPSFVTRYIVRETLGPVLRERFELLRRAHHAAATGTAPKVLDDPEAFEPEELNNPQREALIAFWEEWIEDLKTVRIVDPACGSGAFLIEAFDQLFAEYRDSQARLRELRRGRMTIFDVDRTILTHNLFGVDLNGEAVEIARLSCWIKTAEKGKVLTDLDHNVVAGNSVVDPQHRKSPRELWEARFPEAFKAGGFDVVIGNPPYVRQEWIKADKPYLEEHYRAFDGVADLYVYFYELGLTVLRPGGRLGFIVTNKWMKAGYGEPLRKLYAETAWVESVVDFGHAKQFFPDADVFPSILIARKPDNALAPPERSSIRHPARTGPHRRSVPADRRAGGGGPAVPVRCGAVEPGTARRRGIDGQAPQERNAAQRLRRGSAAVRDQDRVQRRLPDRHADEGQVGHRGPEVGAAVPALPPRTGPRPLVRRVERPVDDRPEVERQPHLAVGRGRRRGRGRVPPDVPGAVRPLRTVPGRADQATGPGRILVGAAGVRLLGQVRQAEGDVPGHHLEPAVLPRRQRHPLQQHGLLPADGRRLDPGRAERSGVVVVRVADRPAWEGRSTASLHGLPERLPNSATDGDHPCRGGGAGCQAHRPTGRADIWAACILDLAAIAFRDRQADPEALRVDRVVPRRVDC